MSENEIVVDLEVDQTDSLDDISIDEEGVLEVDVTPIASPCQGPPPRVESLWGCPIRL